MLAGSASAEGGPTLASTGSVARSGSQIAFHGWSATSRFVAYTRTRFRPGPRRGARPVVDVQRMHRQVRRGAFSGFGAWVGGDVETLAREHEYVITQAPRVRSSATVTHFHVGARSYALEWVVAEHVSWVLREGDIVLAQADFDTIYIACDAELFPAPSGEQAVLLMRLDAGWTVDTGIYPVSLLPRTVPADRAGKGAGPDAPDESR